ncbi:MAG: hypothetical protein GXP43_00385 [bacterium]|nr:hypothetical protein [bacterium]
MQRLKEIHIPTVVALIILALGIGATVFLVQQKQNLKIRASMSLMPSNLKVSNQTAFKGGRAEVTISWQTKEPTSGFILYGMDPDNLSFIATDTRDKNKAQEDYYLTHYVELANLTPNSTVYYTVGVNNLGIGQCQNSQEFCTDSSQCGKDECLPMKLKTPPALASKPAFLAQGQVLDENGQGAEGGIVFITTTGSNLLSALTDQKGQWAVNLSLLRQADLKSYLTLDRQASRVSLVAMLGDKKTQGECLTSDLDPAPPLYLNKPYSCQRSKNQENSKTADQNKPPTPTVSAEPASATPTAAGAKASGFNVEEEVIKILNPTREGEKLATRSPMFNGLGPSKKKLKITVHSSQEISAEVYVDENGQWHWTPPAELEPGEHTVTLSYVDENGETHTASRRFYVAANGQASEVPSYTATASAQTSQTTPTPTLTPTPSLKPTATPTPLPRTSMPSTESGVPKPGYEGVFLLLLGGFGFLTIGLKFLYTEKS